MRLGVHTYGYDSPEAYVGLPHLPARTVQATYIADRNFRRIRLLAKTNIWQIARYVPSHNQTQTRLPIELES